MIALVFQFPLAERGGQKRGAGQCCADEDATWVPTQEREIGFVFQSYALFKHMTCAQNIAFGPSIRKMKIDINSRYPPAAGHVPRLPTPALHGNIVDWQDMASNQETSGFTL